MHLPFSWGIETKNLLCRQSPPWPINIDMVAPSHLHFQEGNKTSGNSTFSKTKKNKITVRGRKCASFRLPPPIHLQTFFAQQHGRSSIFRETIIDETSVHESSHIHHTPSSVNRRKTITNEATTIEEYRIRPSLPRRGKSRSWPKDHTRRSSNSRMSFTPPTIACLPQPISNIFSSHLPGEGL